MNFSDLPPSKRWAALRYKGQHLAEVWFKPEGEPFRLTFRIPRESFLIPGMDKQLTLGNLLRTVTLSPEGVESWRYADVTHPGMNGTNPELESALPVPPQNVTHLDIHVRLQPPAAAVPSVSPPESGAGEAASSDLTISDARWQELQAHWKVILGMEAAIDSLRMSMESLLTEMEGSWKKTLTTEEKQHAPRADVSQWTQAKSRIHHALPKVRDFIHRAVWVLGAPERKKLEAIYNDHIEPRVPGPELIAVAKEIEALQKARQVLLGLGKTVHQEAKAIATDVQNALRTLQNNALANAKQKLQASKGGKFFKDVRRWTKS